MSKDILANIIEDFNPDKFIRFFREKNRIFAPKKEELNQYNDESFKNGQKLGEIDFSGSEQLIVCAFEVTKSLSERSGKKAQYEKGKKILKEQQADAGIFIFYDKKRDFRFSLIYANYLGRKRDWSTFRRFTYFVSQEFTNKTFLQRIGDSDFSTLENIKVAFSVEPVNEEFYAKIAMLFTKLAGGERRIGREEFKGKGLLHLPSTTDDTLNKEFTIRLIGRLVFCWFLKKKHSESGLPLLSNELLSSDALMKNENYYHSILEPLFFETLNTPVEERKNKFQSKPWSLVPFLNGGLFSPDEHDFYEVNESGVSKFLNVLNVPEKWIKDLLEVFETYNFTIDENTSVDIELAIDPEILGRIFENLLAEINPETGETARKSTGSYYTPRPIVEYMVDESLKQYILTKVKISEDKISSLLSYSNEEINLSESEKDSVLDALDVIKIIDPACGSGAFPMGILHKMLLILQRIDPDSQKWIERKLSQIENSTVRKELGKKLREENWNYVHKLGIIQSSIYGVDIQPVATEISRLRFFLSLVVDERVEDDKPNRGIDPLPNLEFKFICANSLIPLEEEGGIFDNKEMAQQMQDIKERYFKTDNDRIKVKMKKDFENVLKKGYSLFASQKQKQLLTYHPFDTNNICNFFDSKFMFGVDFFDIVIANPPYVFTRKMDFSIEFKEYVQRNYLSQLKSVSSGRAQQSGKINLFALFVMLGVSLSKETGLITYITPNTLLRTTTYDIYRKYILDYTNILQLVDLGGGVFNKVTAATIVFILQREGKENARNANRIKAIFDISNLESKNFKIHEIQQDTFYKNTSFAFNMLVNERMGRLMEKIKSKKIPLGEFCLDIIEGIVAHKHLINEEESKNTYPLLEGKDIKRYFVGATHNNIIWDKSKIHRTRPDYVWGAADKIVIQRISGGCSPIVAALDRKKHRTFASINNLLLKNEFQEYYQCILALLNSKLINYYYANNFSNNSMLTVNISKTFLEKLPIPQLSLKEREILTGIVDKILNITKDSDYIAREEKKTKVKEYEREIDQMVYKLYGLTEEEIKIVEDFDKG